jgi:ATP-binding cassette subfamily F protein 3
MAVLTVTNLSKSYGPEEIFSRVSFSIPNNGRVAIVGPNGIGKTSLLRVLADEESATSGEFHIARSATLGYLPQEARAQGEHSLWEECLRGVEDLRRQEAQLKEIEARLEDNAKDQALLTRYGKLQQAFELAGGYTYENRIGQVLTGLGFSKDEYHMPLPHLSGGQRTRAELARLLLATPDLLILDEPTKHLDIEAVEWLESYLKDWDGAALIVSHDRYFLDQVVTHVYEMSRFWFEFFRGNYTHFVQQRDARWEERKQFYQTELARMEKELDYIRKNIAGQRVQMAKGKLSRLSREIEAIEKLGFDAVRSKKWSQVADQAGGIDRKPMRVDEAAQRLGALRTPDDRVYTVGLQIRAPQRSGNIVLQAENLTIGYPNVPLFRIDELELRRLECAALIGPNGSGKTTFLKTLLKEIQPLSGELRPGASLKIGYFAQAHEELNPNLTLIEEIDRVGTAMLEKDIRNYLGRFLFRGDEHYKKVSVLSGGERGRLALAKLALLDANFLLLDEPSNHLDIPGQEVLQQVLADFNGTILMVSHDRYLISALASQIWEIDTDSRELNVFKGSYQEYKGIQEPLPEIPQQVQPVTASTPQPEPKPELSKHERKRLETRIAALEDKILGLENLLEEISKKLQAPPDSPDEIQQLGEDYAYNEAKLQSAMEQWENLHAQLD